MEICSGGKEVLLNKISGVSASGQCLCFIKSVTQPTILQVKPFHFHVVYKAYASDNVS